jgi:16S rRNA (cytosine1402-N4)-methyltransferase
MHIPVLIEEIEELFSNVAIKVFFDGTLGAGGHAKRILETHGEIERYIGCDRDPQALEIAAQVLAPWKKKVQFVRGSFSEIDRFLTEEKIGCVDGALLDLGLSSMQLDSPERGFSFQRSGRLDMRMDPQIETTAEEIVNRYSEKELSRIFRDFGEEPQWRKAVKGIIEARRRKPIHTTKELSDLLEKVVRRRGKIHPATRVFQALRMEVNQELALLQIGLEEIARHLSPKGRMGVISFHSLEDRIVKLTFKDLAKEADGNYRLVMKKPLAASREEIRKNPRSRSAKLRAIEKVDI